ncbi:MAG: gliding motility-associated C-terminal domain-containing protein [Bacteroidota bacterium]
MANDKWIEEIAGKLKEHSSEVNPQMWQGISSQIGAGSAGVAGGLGFAKIAGIVGIAVATVAITYFAVDSSDNDIKEEQSTVQIADKEIVDENEPLEIKENKILDTPIKIESNSKIIDKPIDLTDYADEPVHQENQKGLKNGEIATPLAQESILKNKVIGDVQKVAEEPKQETKTSKVVETPKVAEKVAGENNTETVLGHDNKRVISEAPVEKEASTARFTKLPNIFTPNNDGVNDYFFVESTGMKNYALVIMDISNNVLWKTSNPNDKWDGRNMGGEKVPSGSYIYFITAEDEKGNKLNTHQRLEIQ